WYSGPDVAVFDGVLVELLLQQPSSPVEPALDGPDGGVEHAGDLGVGQPLEVAQDDGLAELVRQPVERVEDRVIDDLPEELALRVALEARGEEHAVGRGAGVRLVRGAVDDLVVPDPPLVLAEERVPTDPE